MLFFLINLIRHLTQRLRQVLGGRAPDPAPAPVDPTHKRVVILGGGVAGVCAAFWLSAPQQRGRYQITLYTQGWRLGGKCASGRNPEFDRIEEHGLHILLGCYHNAFVTLRACYAAWQRPPTHPFRSWRDAFKPQRSITLMEQDGEGEPPVWLTWDFAHFPALPGEPGDAPADPAAGLDASYLRMLDQLDAFAPHLDPEPSYCDAVTKLRETITGIEPQTRGEARRLALAASAGLEQAPLRSPAAQRLAIMARLGLCIAHGYVADVFAGGDQAIDALNRHDFRVWLCRNGADDTVANSAPVRAIYDLAFAYQDGDPGHGTIAAGVTLRFILEVVFAYRDAPLWRMAAGTGDTVFAPMYRVLQQRGVDIRLFHRVTALRPSADGRLLGEIELAKQVETRGVQPYDPFRKLGELDVWPNQPKWELLDIVPGPTPPDYEQRACTASVGPPITLRAGAAFDLAIVALPPPVLEEVAAPLAAISVTWQIALGHSRSVPTQALQLWLRPDAAALGWTLPPAILTAYAKPFDSWADMSVVQRYETWPAHDMPCSISYFCGCLKIGGGDPVVAADAWLTAHAASLWPAAPPTATWADAGGPLLRRYDRANTDVAERYIQTPHGDNVGSRLRPDQPAWFTNLYAVGDWTRTRYSGGCFESAVESAMLAANAISGFPARASIKTS